MTDFVLTIPSQEEATAWFAAFGLTDVDAKGRRTLRTQGVTSRADMEVLAQAVEATRELVERETAKGEKLETATVERVKITPQMTVKPTFANEKERKEYQRELTEWVSQFWELDGQHYLVLRWNGDAMLPPMPPKFEVIYDSSIEGFEYPENIVRIS